MNSFAMIFGHCVWIPPSPKAALVALGLFFGIGVGGEPDVAADEALIAGQYVSAGKTEAEAQKEVAWLNDLLCQLRGAGRPEKPPRGGGPDPSAAGAGPEREIAAPTFPGAACGVV